MDEKNNDSIKEMNEESDKDDECSAEELIGEENENDNSNKNSLERDILDELERVRYQNNAILF